MTTIHSDILLANKTQLHINERSLLNMRVFIAKYNAVTLYVLDGRAAVGEKKVA